MIDGTELINAAHPFQGYQIRRGRARQVSYGENNWKVEDHMSQGSRGNRGYMLQELYVITIISMVFTYL